MKFIHTNKTAKSIRRFVVAAIVVLAGACFCHVLLPGNTMAANVSLTVNNTNTVLEMYVPASVTLDLMPSSGKAFDTEDLDIWVGTNSGAGYTLKMQAESVNLTRSNSITDREYNKSVPLIEAMGTSGSVNGYTAAQFESSSSDSDTLNRWGYKLSTATNYMPMAKEEVTLSTTNTRSNGANVTLNFAAKVDASQPTGTYATTLNFVAVTNNTNTALTINYNGNGLHFGNDPSNVVNVVTYDATTTYYPVSQYAHSYNFDDGNDTPVIYSYKPEMTVSPVELIGASSLKVDLKYGLNHYLDGFIDNPDYLFVLNGYYTEDSYGIADLYNVMFNVCYQDISCAKERMAFRDVDLLEVYSGAASVNDFTAPAEVSFGVNGDSVTFVLYGNYGEEGNGAYGYYATVQGDAGDFTVLNDKTVLTGTYAVPVSSSDIIEFLGWSENPMATVPTYKNEADVKARLEAVNGDAPVTLYAVYLQTDIEMQELTPSLCTAAGTYVYDNRNNKIYLVRRLPDNRCWMLDNLALDLSDSNIQQELSTTNTNADDHSLQCLISGEYNGSRCSSPYATARAANWSSSNSYTEPLVATSGQCDAGDDCADDPSPGYWSADSVVYPTFGDGDHKIGIYYNYCAASAGSYCYTAEDGSGDAVYDICPKGWHMLTGTESGEYWDLWREYLNGIGSSYFRDGFSTVYSGYFVDGLAMNQGYDGEWWSSTVPYGSSSSVMGYVSSGRTFIASAGRLSRRQDGLSVRCVLTEP